MTTYNTGNPIGSTDARDLYDNAQNLDNFANGTAASYTDRLGVSRRSLSGIDAAADNVLNSIGYSVPVAYASGISLTLTSQTVDYNGVIYAPLSSALPFTTSSWGDDSSKFRAIQATDADLISYTPAGTGAVATTVQSKLREAVSVKDFGAVGDGVTDDTAAIQAAIDAVESAGGGEVNFENKTYILNSRIYWKSNVLLRGAGQTILKVANGVDSPVIGIVNQQTTPAITNIGAFGVIFDGNYQNSPGVTAFSAVILDPVDKAYFERCVFRNARGYGASLQYLATGVPDNNRVKNITFLKCDFENNGWGLATPGTLYDGIDIKNGTSISFINCRSFDNADKGFNPRGENIEFIACEAYNNGGSGIEINANANGYTQSTSVKIIGGHFHTNTKHGVSIVNDTTGGNGLTRVDIIGALIRGNTLDGVNFNENNSFTYATINAKIFANGRRGIAHVSTKNTILNWCQIVNNTSDGVYTNSSFTLQINGGLIEGNGGWGYLEGSSATRNVLDGGIKILGNTSGNISLNSVSLLTKVNPSVSDYTPNSTSPSDIIASASTIKLPQGGQVFAVTGTNAITDITLTWRGRIVTLQFLTTASVIKGGTLQLNSNFNATANDTLTLACNGSLWFEVSRSAN